MEAATPEIIVVSDSAALSRTAADIICRRMQATLSHADQFCLALAGGSTPRGLYAMIAEEPGYRDWIPWHRIHFFWGDERHVSPDHVESNYRIAYEAMLSKITVPTENIHRVMAEIPDADQAAAAYEQELRDFFKPKTDELPRFDCILLGMGPDGHTASLFPATTALNERKQWVTANWVEKSHTNRITMTVPVLNNAALIIFLVSGPDKAAVLHEVLEGNRQPNLFPSQLIRPSHGRLIWLVDQAAAARLDHPR